MIRPGNGSRLPRSSGLRYRGNAMSHDCLVMKRRGMPSGKGFDFEITDDWNQLYPDELKRIGVPLLTPNIDDCRLLQKLPKHHGDPFDHMLVCQAKRLGLGIISVDKIIDSYQVRRVW